MNIGEVFRSLDWVALAASLFLVAVGLAMLLSATYTETLFSELFIRQSVAVVVGALLFLLLVWIPYHAVARYALAAYLVGIGGLGVVALLGPVIRGTISRLEVLGVQIQPSEFMKVALVVVLAWFFTRRTDMSIQTVARSAILAGLPICLIALEPDLGTATVAAIVWACLIVFLGLPWRSLTVLVIVAALTGAALWQWGLADYQRQRLLTFLNPAGDPLGSGYNITQSIVAFGSGQLFGRGLGHGPQSQLKFLPERHTDFILSSIGEELGFLGVVLVLTLYAVLLWRIVRVARITQDQFGRLLCVGTFLFLAVSLLVNAGANVGLLPVTGIPLPLVSYGGSSLVSTMMLLGLVQSSWVYSKWVQAHPTEISHIP